MPEELSGGGKLCGPDRLRLIRMRDPQTAARVRTVHGLAHSNSWRAHSGKGELSALEETLINVPVIASEARQSMRPQ